MRKKTVEIYDDLDGDIIEKNEDVHVVTFSFLGENYRIELRTANFNDFEEAIEAWTMHATKTGGTRKGTNLTNQSITEKAASTPAKPKPKPKKDKDQLRVIREWAWANGYTESDVAPKGRIRQSVVDAFDEAHANTN